MNIVQICYDAQSPPTQLAELARRGLSPIHNVTMVYLTGAPPAEKQAHHVYLDMFGSRWRAPFWRIIVLIQLYRLYRQYRFDVLITHRSKPFWLGAVLACLVPFQKKIAVFHGVGELKRSERRRFIRWFAQSWEVVGISRAVQQDLIDAQAFRPESVHMIPNAMDVPSVCARQFSRTEARQRLGLREHDFVFGTIGRLVPKKGHADLIEAFALLRQHFPERHMVLVIIGDGRLRETLQALIAQRGLEMDVILAGYYPEASRYLLALDTFVFPSHDEGFGLVLLEAMAAHCPIIATHVGGIPEVLDDKGVQVPPGAPALLSAAMASLLTQSPHDRESEGAALYQRLCQHFSQTPYWEAYRELVGN